VTTVGHVPEAVAHSKVDALDVQPIISKRLRIETLVEQQVLLLNQREEVRHEQLKACRRFRQ
jgi:hypothetical protein